MDQINGRDHFEWKIDDLDSSKFRSNFFEVLELAKRIH
jgi:hypothetical protein